MTDNVPEKKKKEVVIEQGKTGKNCPIRFEFDGEKLEKTIVKKGFSGQEALERVFGTSDAELVSEIINHSTNAMGGHSQEKKQNALIQYLADSQPQNTTEAKLYAQAHVLFSQGMLFIGYARNENMVCQQEHYLKNGFKFLRLHDETLQTLDRLRRKEQRIVVQHVTVNDGGQAAILTKIDGGGGVKEKGDD